jgi:hypothetical protein
MTRCGLDGSSKCSSGMQQAGAAQPSPARAAPTGQRLLAQQPLRLAAELLRRLARQQAGRRDLAPRAYAEAHDAEPQRADLGLGPAGGEAEVPPACGRGGCTRGGCGAWCCMVVHAGSISLSAGRREGRLEHQAASSEACPGCLLRENAAGGALRSQRGGVADLWPSRLHLAGPVCGTGGRWARRTGKQVAPRAPLQCSVLCAPVAGFELVNSSGIGWGDDIWY